VGRQGYRFIAPLIIPVAPALSSDPEETQPPQLEIENWHLTTPFIGREQELARLHELFDRARRGERQTVFLFGEPGIGKTTLIDRFLDQVQAGGPVRIGRGQCVEHYGAGEAYLPLLEAWGQLCQEPGGEQVLAVLRRRAPLWLAQLPGLLEAGERDAVRQYAQGGGQERMLRELAETLEIIAADAPLVLVLEDLQWSDASTVDAVAYLARRRYPAQLVVLGTYRSADVALSGHSVRQVVQELYGRKLCEELPLELFTEGEVEEYLRQRFGPSAAVTKLSPLIYRRTDGNALFVVSFVDHLLERELLVQAGGQVQLSAELSAFRRLVPNSLQQVVLRQIESLSVDEQRLLQVASVEGRSFTAAAVAGVIERTVEEVEATCDRLASRERVITEAGVTEWPDGGVTARYEFRHALYPEVLYEQLGQARRVRLHRQLGEWKEGRYGDRVGENAGELIVHFTEGRDYRRAGQYHRQAAETAQGRSAYREAIEHCQKGLKLLERLPDTPECPRQELALRMILSAALTATRGFGADELIQNLSRARELCWALNDDATLVSVLVGLGRFYDLRADREAIEQLTGEELHLLERVQEPVLATQLHTHLGTSSMVRGALGQAQEHHARALELYDPQRHRELVLHFGLDPAVVAGIVSGWSLWLAGRPDQARARSKQGLSRARELGHLFSLAYAFIDSARVQLWCGNLDEAERLAKEGVSLANEHGIAWFIRAGSSLQGCIRVQRGECEAGLSMLAESVAQYRSAGVLHLFPLHLSSLADAYRQVGRVEEGLATIAEALHTTETGTTAFWAAEVYRLKGELTLQKLQVSENRKAKSKGQKSKITNLQSPTSNTQEEAEACFLKAIAIARQQEAKSLELRATTSLARLWQWQGKHHEARTALSAIYDWFTEGFDTKDLQEAKALLQELV
jgi:tetratricopeptide (TPR) repeat protein